MLRFFENLIDPYPRLDASHPQAQIPPASFWGFIRYSLHGLGKHFAALIALTALIAALEALLFGFLGRMVDWLANVPPAQLWQQEGRTLLLLALAIVSIPVLSVLHAMLQMQALNGNLPMRLRWVYHNLMLRQSMGFYQSEFSGRVAAKLMQTALAVRDMCNILCDVMVFVVVYFITLVALVGQFHPLMLLPLVLWVLAYAGALGYFIPRLARISQQQADARSLMTGRVTDAYANIHTVKLFSHAGRESRYAQGAMQEFMRTVYRQMRMVSGLNISNNVLSFSLIAGATGLALWLWSQELITVGAVAAACAMTLRLNGMAHWFMFESAMLFEHVGTIRDGMGMLSQPNQVVDSPDARLLQVSRGEVRFENIRFAYGAAASRGDKTLPADANLAAPARQEVISGLNLTLWPGEKIGLVGPSGAGKSTLANLLLRFYELETGRICIDGQDIRQVTQDSLRQAIGMVTQDTALLHRTIRENILYGRPDASEAEMIEAARRAQAHDFIQTLNDGAGGQGYEAQVGERGVKLSGGQRQRIAIARVMLKNAPILLLDEATSALDSEVETAIQESLYQLMQGKTVIAIAHRLSTIAAMDRLVVLDQGRIVEEGTHTQLIEQGGLYARLWMHQSGGFLGVDI
ncbi:MAG: ABC transporter ATP-binding protein [Brachymonas sp.]|nr:ABC transporter ATP-binding protein [Brachymonas sp.]